MGVFWWIPALVPLVGVLILLVGPQWPIARWEGAKSEDEIKKNWCKFGIYMFVNIILCLLFAWGSWMGAVAETKFPEVLNFCVTGIRHEMKWTTHETYIETYTTGSGNNTQAHTRTVHYTESHGPYWYSINEYDKESPIPESEYNKWKAVWGGERQIGTHKGSSAYFDRSIDGPIYTCSWPHTFDTIWPGTVINNYVNKIRISHSVLKYGEATKRQKERFLRPADKGNTSPFVIYGGIKISKEETIFLQRINASFGRQYEIHPILVVFDKNESREVITDVLSAWQGPNKNELVTFISLDGQTIRWVEVHSWMDDTTLHATLRDELMGQQFIVKRYGELLQKYVPKMWHRKHFTPINAYLHVSINPRWIILAIVLSAIATVGSYFIINRLDSSKRRA